jgi:O-antigen/teichoic acid export membrane protein
MREIGKAFSKTVSGTAISLLISTVSVKIMATLLGPSGMGLYGMLRQIHSTTMMAATMGGQTALVQGGSTKVGKDRSIYLQTVLILFLASGCLASGILILLAPFLAEQLLKRQDPSAIHLIRALSLPILLTLLSSYAVGVLNIHRALGYMAVIQVLVALIGFVCSYPVALAVHQGKELALIGLMSATQSVNLGLAIWWLWRQKLLAELFGKIGASFDRPAARYFFSFAGVTVITSLLNSSIVLILRGLIVKKYDLAGVGIFDAAWTLCVTYISLISGAFGTYYLPTLSKLTDRQEITDLIQRVLLFIAIISAIAIAGIILLKKQIILLLFSADFTPSLSLLRWLLIADYLKMLSWVLAFPMLAFSHLRLFFITEVIWNLIMLVGFYLAIEYSNSLEGIGLSVLFSYITYLMFTLWFVWKYYQFIPNLKTVSIAIVGSILVLAVSKLTWNYV